MPALCHRHVGLPSLSAFLLAAKYRKADGKGGKEKKNNSWCIWEDETRQPVQLLNGPWIVTGPPPSLRNAGSVRHFAYRLQWVLGLGQAEQQAICWLLFWQNCQGLSSIKWWIELSGSKEASRASSACVFFWWKEWHRETSGSSLLESLKNSSVGVWQNIMWQTNKQNKENTAVQFGTEPVLITCPYVFSNI